jgi:hypothetical protein
MSTAAFWAYSEAILFPVVLYAVQKFAKKKFFFHLTYCGKINQKAEPFKI